MFGIPTAACLVNLHIRKIKKVVSSGRLRNKINYIQVFKSTMRTIFKWNNINNNLWGVKEVILSTVLIVIHFMYSYVRLDG